jgi:hypothetical protein
VSDSSRDLLDSAYVQLGYAEGDLLSASPEPNESTSSVWVDKGDWLALASQVKAEKVFFVDNYPVVVFAEQKSQDQTDWVEWFNSVWCMARPQLLFLARDGELSVFNLTKQPARKGEDPKRYDRLLDVAKVATEVQTQLHRYRREQVESGRLFEDSRFGFEDRADRALVRDLGRVRAALIKAGLAPQYAHALIGRSIFIRYLEDREVLTQEYFRKVAAGDKEQWNSILDEAAEAAETDGEPNPDPIYYPYVLTNKAFTYALFTRLAKEFNGDMFPVDHEEQKAVSEAHLNLLHDFLLGGKDEKLFFFAYRFDIIPIELISSIYEKFYSLEKKKRRNEGSYYTPSALVDFVLSHTLTEELLDNDPRVMDPACGSGIFLVEAFRRIVRHKVGKKREPLTPDELRGILKYQIAGIDISGEAIRVAAFSLYLAMLHYLKPPDILQHKLPCLTYGPRTKKDHKRHYDILIAENAFRIKETVSDEAVRNRFLSGCADVVVGNPPWGAPPANEPKETRSDGGMGWCGKRGFAVGDKERSQTFIHRTIDLLKDGGRAGLLVSTGVFFKRHANTKLFRRQWLEKATLKKVVNFAAVRDAFFRTAGEDGDGPGGAIAPFAAVVFDKGAAEVGRVFSYWSAKETALVKLVQAVVLNRADLRTGEQDAYKRDDTLWKIYWWGGHRDEALIQRLRLESSFQSVVDPDGTRMRVGFQEASRKDAAGWLRKYDEFPTDAFVRYGPLPLDQFVRPPTRVHRRRDRSIYQGARLLIKRGIDQNREAGGQIAARYETENFCFRDSIHCAPLPDLTEAQAKILLAILWSSITRYYLFLTSGTWGLWHDEVKKDVLYSLPVCFPEKDTVTAKIVGIVDSLRSLPAERAEATLFEEEGLTKPQRDTRIRALEAELDQAVFDLFEMDDEERDLVDEMCGLGLDLFYRGMKSEAVKPLPWPASVPKIGRLTDLDNGTAKTSELCGYLRTFCKLWEPQLTDQDGRFRWRVLMPPAAVSMTAVIFETETPKETLPDVAETELEQWHQVLKRLVEVSRQPAKAQRIVIDGLIRIVTDSEIVIIKRNERRLWTRSAARDDAEATMVMTMHMSRTGE